jgi:hypothetical protein
MLLRLQADFLCSRLAEVKKQSELMPKFGEDPKRRGRRRVRFRRSHIVIIS